MLHWMNVLWKKTTKIAIFTGVREQKPMFSVIPDLGMTVTRENVIFFLLSLIFILYERKPGVPEMHM